ncbi:MAG: superoxide dismutase family protein [Burkholderiales bacterium]|nr:superoxide dismutase family protein [Burkholderiales bacterium]
MTALLRTSLSLMTCVPLLACSSLTGKEKPLVATAEIRPTTAAISSRVQPTGAVRMTQLTGSKMLVEAEIRGLRPFAEHGFNIQATADCSTDPARPGAHFNPDGNPHNHPDQLIRHAGAMRNLRADSEGVARVREQIDIVTLAPGRYGIDGLAIVVHRDPDDYVSQPVGNAGPRIGCGVVRVAPAAA